MASWSLSQYDVTLTSQRAQQDRQRYLQRVDLMMREALSARLGYLAGDPTFVLGDEYSSFPFALPREEYEQSKNYWQLEPAGFRFATNEGIGQGVGNSKPGDKIWADEELAIEDFLRRGTVRFAPSRPRKVLRVDDVEKLLFANLALPSNSQPMILKTKKSPIIVQEVRRSESLQNLDWRRTMKATILRRTKAGQSRQFRDPHSSDLRFRMPERAPEPQVNAVLFLLMDATAVMGPKERYLARCLSFWIQRFLRRSYENVQVIRLIHQEHAKAVETDHDLFTTEWKGPRHYSPAYELVSQQILGLRREEWQMRWPARDVYCFHFANGEPSLFDVERAAAGLLTLGSQCVLAGYCEIYPEPEAYSSYLGRISSYYWRYAIHHNIVTATVLGYPALHDTLQLLFPAPRSP